MSLTADQITAGSTYSVRLAPRSLSFKRMADAKRFITEAGGRYDEVSQAWTITVGDAETQILTCRNAWHEGSRASWAVDGDGQCARCHGSGQITHIEEPGGLDALRTLARSYGAVIEPAAAGRPAPARTRQDGPGSATRRLSRAYGMDMAEYGDGFTPEEREAFGGR